MLSLSEKYLNAGDRVVLAIEPTSETFSTYFGATAFWKCAESSPELLFECQFFPEKRTGGGIIWPICRSEWKFSGPASCPSPRTATPRPALTKLAT